MAKQKSVPSKNTFAEILFKLGHRFSLSKVFDDFLTMAIAACTQNPLTKLSYYEDEYLETIAYYKDSELRHEFPKAFTALIIEMEERVGSSLGNDVLGDFFEQNISNGRNGQYFTPYPICEFMASITNTDTVVDKPLRILDPACGSGRMLLAAHKKNGIGHEYYGIDIDRSCVKMAALNLFLNGIWNSEVMCANSLSPNDFTFSYRISFLPLGIFKIIEKEKSKLWVLHKNSFLVTEKIEPLSSSIVLDKTPFSERTKDNSTQLGLF
jgi:type I restriction-modification system DNA methylase subunit